MNLSNYEKETIINYNEAEAVANVFTFNPKLTHKLAKLAEERPDECKFIRESSDGGVEYEVPKKWVKVGPLRTVNMTDEQRKEASERMRQLRSDSKL